MKEIIIVISAIALAFLLLSIRIILKKNGTFSSQNISENRRMREDGIHCATSQDRETRRKNKNKINVNQL